MTNSTETSQFSGKLEPNPYYIFKICLLGAGAVGKTCICRRLCLNTFDYDTKMTIGINFYSYDIPVLVKSKKENIRLSIWDFGGQDQFKRLFPYYINGANGIFMCFSVVNFQSLLNLEWWYEETFKYTNLNIPRVVLGTKRDLIDSSSGEIKVNELIIKQFLNKHEEKDYFQISSKEDVNIMQSFLTMTKKMLENTNLNINVHFQDEY